MSVRRRHRRMSVVAVCAALALAQSGCGRKAFSAEVPASELLAGIHANAAPLILDVFGRWDPTLAFVMGSALAVSALGFALSRGRARPFLAETFSIPTRRDVDARLIGGAALFGIGWGLVGLCPGPALANLSRGSADVFVFAGAMFAGVVIHRVAVGRKE